MTSKIQKLDCRQETEEVEESERGNWSGLPPELLNMIFDRLPIADLLSCSVVSKTWKKASRDVLKRSRECYAHIKNFPQDVHDLIDQIASTEIMQMVNGLHIQMRPKHNNENGPSPRQEFCGSKTNNVCKSKETLRKLINVALSGQVRYLTLDMDDEWKQNWPTDDVALLRALISETGDSLQKLVIWQDKCCEFMSSCGKEFSMLKVVTIQYNEFLDESYLNGFLTRFAPNLDEVTGGMLMVAISIEENPFVLKRSKNLIVYHHEMNAEVFLEAYRYISGLQRLDLQVCQCDTLDEYEDDDILLSMVRESSNTLKELRMYTPEFYKLFQTSAQLKFPNLRRLTLATDFKMPVGNEITILKQLNLPKLCPNLEQLDLSMDMDPSQYTDNAYDEEDFLPAALPYGTDQSDMPLQIAFQCRDDHYSHEYFEFLNEIYPKINKVRVLNWELGDSISEMSSIFSDIPALKYLEINPNYGCPDAFDLQMDALLCGISFQEVEFLFNSSPRPGNAELNPCIVPIRPSLFNAKNLKEIKIAGEGPGAFVNYSWVIQVTENLAARHVRLVKVTFEGTEELYNRLNRLRAFTTLLCLDSVAELKQLHCGTICFPHSTSWTAA